MELEAEVVGEHPVNFKYVSWAPDGTSLLTLDDENTARVYNAATREMETGYKSSESLNAAAWYPWMRRDMQATNCFLACSRNEPLKLVDAQTSAVRASYRPIDQKDELDACVSCCFSPDGTRIFAGADERIYHFSTLGQLTSVIKTNPSRRSRDGQRGIVSCLASRWDDSGVLAAGSFSGSMGIYDTRASEPLVLLMDSGLGVTQLAFGPGGMELYSGHRHGSQIAVWDLRTGGRADWAFERPAATNQRLYFSCTGSSLVSGSSAPGEILVFDIEQARCRGDAARVRQPGCHGDVVSAASHNPVDPSAIATCSGQRHYGGEPPVDNSVKLWRI